MSKILAIDDKRDNLITITALLKNLIEDCTIVTSQTGEGGIVKAKMELPDVIILDVKMPEMDGFEVCRILKSDNDTMHIPVILLTAIRTDMDSRIKGLEIGADAFLTKPIDEAELVAQINVMLRIKRAEDMLRKEKDLLEDMVKERTEALYLSEQELAKERDFMKSLEDASPAFYLAISPAGETITMNRALLEALGYGLNEIKGMDFFDTFMPETDGNIARKIFGL